MSPRWFLGLGSNLGDRRSFLAAALREIGSLPRTVVTGLSSVYLTAPVGKVEQPPFLNQVVEVTTVLAPRALLEATQEIERRLGRERSERWGPRNIDIDLLWYDGPAIREAGLEVPHPRLEERRFVLEPLAELAPHLRLPSGLTVADALAWVRGQQVRRLEAGVDMAHGSEVEELQQELRALARERNAVILAHNYQRAEVQDVADYVGDSLGLSRQAAASDAEIILFCGVDFMAETAAILAPDKKVVLPDSRACCPMAQMVDVEGLEQLKAAHPRAEVVSYVNTSAAVKALSHVCCTSANAVAVVASIPEDREVIFTPDRNLGAWVQKQTGRPMILWEGFCPTHETIQLEDVESARQRFPGARVVVHPECLPEVSAAADAVESTSGMIRYCREDAAEEFVIGTEAGMIHRLQMDVPGKVFHLLTSSAVCPNMKLTTLAKAVKALRAESPLVVVPEEIRFKALAAVERMVSIGR